MSNVSIRYKFNRWLRRFFLLYYSPIAAAYVFAFVPILFSVYATEEFFALTIIGLILYIPLLLFAVEITNLSFNRIYNRRNRPILPIVNQLKLWRLFVYRSQKKHTVVRLCIFSFFMFNFAFATAYSFISHQPGAFKGEIHNFIDALYFCTATTTTVGFGDIYPLSMTSRALVTLHMYLSLFYGILLLSGLGSFIKSKPILSSRKHRVSPTTTAKSAHKSNTSKPST